MQGGGSLGAFACGVYKGLVKKNIRVDIAAGTSIGAVNAELLLEAKAIIQKRILKSFGQNWQKAVIVLSQMFLF